MVHKSLHSKYRYVKICYLFLLLLVCLKRGETVQKKVFKINIPLCVITTLQILNRY